jgi:signal peptidase I
MRGLMQFLSRNKGFIVFMIGMVMFRSAFADWSVVPTGSMQPTINIGDRIFIDKAAYDIRLPKERLVKRVVGIPGDEIALRGNVLYVNGVAATYAPTTVQGIHDDIEDPASYEIERVGNVQHLIRLSLYRPSNKRDFGPVKVPAGQYLLMGDNRDNSMDSRYLGFIPRNEIVGRSRYVALSLDPNNHYLPRQERFGARLDNTAPVPQ